MLLFLNGIIWLVDILFIGVNGNFILEFVFVNGYVLNVVRIFVEGMNIIVVE